MRNPRILEALMCVSYAEHTKLLMYPHGSDILEQHSSES
jgi:hypothetical protein